MIISLLNTIGEWNKEGERTSLELFDFLHTMNVTCFDQIYNQKETIEVELSGGAEKKEVTKFTHQQPYHIIIYLLYAFSPDSPFLILGNDYQQEKMDICNRLDIPHSLRETLINLDDSAVRGAALDYIAQYGTPLWFKDLQVLLIQHNEANIAMAKGIMKYNKDTDKYEPDAPGQSKAVVSFEAFSKRLQIKEEEIRNQHRTQLRFLQSISEEVGERRRNDRLSFENLLKKNNGAGR